MKSPRRTRPLKLIQRNNVWVQLTDPNDYDRIAPLLSYEQEWWEDVLFKCNECENLVSKKEALVYATKEGCSFGRVPCLECGSLERWFVGKRRLKKKRTCQVPMVSKKGFLFAGFMPYLQERFNVELDRRQEGFGSSVWENSISLRPYQMDAFVQVGLKLRGQISMPTGTGKTVLAAAILASCHEARSLFVVHTKDLLLQTIDEFNKFLGVTIGVVGDSLWLWDQVTVGMIQSLKDYSHKENPVDVVMVDEAHHASASSYIDLLKKMDCPIRLGFTGTPRSEEKDREGWLKAMGILGPVIYEYSYQQAVADGWLSQAIVRVLKTPMCLEAMQETNYRKVYNEGIIKNEERNRLIVREAGFFADRGLTCLVQVKETRHGEILDDMFDGRAEYVCGADKAEERKRVKELLKSKKVNVAIVSPIYDEGVDIPSLDAIVIAGGGLSETKSIQKVGRGLRKTDEKDTVQVVDFMDISHKFLKKHSRERIKTYKSKGWEVKEDG